jgi:leucyl aminopeptidase
MKIQSVSSGSDTQCDIIVRLSFSDVTRTDSILAKFLNTKNFQGKPGQISPVVTIDGRAMLFIGLGKEQSVTAETIRRAGGDIVKALKKECLVSALVEWPLSLTAGWQQALAEGMWLADYTYGEFKSETDTIVRVETITIGSDSDNIGEPIKNAAIDVLGVVLARDLVNRPSNHLTPVKLVEAATVIAENSPDITIDALDRAALKSSGLNALLAVAQGSDEEPYLIHLTYKSKAESARKIAIVGKGITFDSGGITLKPSGHIEDMKIDMAGAATVLGLFKILTFLELPVEIHGLIPTCENMPSGHATRPGDVITSHSGKTIEIVNTDAEGRLILADALSYAAKEIKPDTMVDLATLTGACMVALGAEVAAVMSNDQKLVAEIIAASQTTGESIWQLPLVDDYKDELKSDIADLKNVGESKNGGAINGGLFLAEFVPDNIRFAHIDIAGPAHVEKAKHSYLPKGGTGFGVRTLIEWLSGLK